MNAIERWFGLLAIGALVIGSHGQVFQFCFAGVLWLFLLNVIESRK